MFLPELHICAGVEPSVQEGGGQHRPRWHMKPTDRRQSESVNTTLITC